MAPQRIISWAANLTSSPPIESISSDSSSGHAAQSQVKSMSLLPVLEDKKTGVQHANDDTYSIQGQGHRLMCSSTFFLTAFKILLH